MYNQFETCVMAKETRLGGRCYGLDDCICLSGVKCPFYGSKDTHIRDSKTGFVRRKKRGYKNHEKIYI
jgi:hypothetical protein